MRITTIFAFLLALAIGVFLGLVVNVTSSPSHLSLPALPAPTNVERNPDLQQAQHLLDYQRPNEAFAILSGLTQSIDLDTPDGKEWLRLLVETYSSADNHDQLLLIHEQYPEALYADEHASLSVADSLISRKQLDSYQLLRQQWHNKESELTRWILLDAQASLLDGNPQGAASLLQNHRFRGNKETDRLLRLAALSTMEDPEQALHYLTEAVYNDPHNADLRTFKASLDEALDHYPDALADYINAVQYDPESPFRREQLADFYLRIMQYPQALTILQDTMSPPSLDTIWLKAIFWSHLTIAPDGTWKKESIPDGSLKGFVAYLLSLPPGIYWDQRAFQELEDHETYSNTRQETFWFQLLSALKNGREAQALEILNNNLFQYMSWAPELERGLKTLLRYRLAQQSSSHQALASASPLNGKVENPQQLLALLSSLSEIADEQIASAIPAQMQNYLLSKEAFAVPFLAVNWTEAALQLHVLDQFPDAFPSWMTGEMAQALKQNRGSKAALTFLLAQKASPSNSLLTAELALEVEEKEVAFNALKQIYTHSSESGRKAALLLGQFLAEHDNLLDAKKAILAQPGLAKDVAAREMLARIAIQENDVKKALILYLELENESSEAKSFLARKAFADGNWTRARQLTEALLKEHPENPVLTENLQKIIAEEKQAKP